MTVKVFMWPPVGAIGTEWTEEAPVQISRSMVTGAERVSAVQRKRRLATLTVPGFGRSPYDAGYIEILKRHLEGVHLVRLNSYPINWHFDSETDRLTRGSTRLLWTADGDPLDWTASSVPLYWFSGTVLAGTSTTVSGASHLAVTGLPPSILVARPGEFVTVYPSVANDTGAVTAQIAVPAYSDAGGAATLRLFDPIANGAWARVSIGTSQSAVFRPEAYPRARQPYIGNWEYEWAFREAFADEVGGFEEINPWL